VRALDVGAGAREVLAAPGRGRVVSVHGKAAYLRVDGRLVALVAPTVPPGPLHVRCPALPSLRAGAAVNTDGRRLAGPDWAVSLEAPTWCGALPAPDALARGADGPDGVAETDRLAGAVPDASEVLAPVRAGRLEAVAGTLGGRGPGLTPAGDDLLAGLVLVARAWWGPVSTPRLAGLVDGVDTTEVARAFLAWAARGQCVAPVHDWLGALAGGGPLDGPRRRLLVLGASSGAALAAGLALGVAQLPRVDSQIARAVSGEGLCQRTRRSAG